MKNLGGFWLVLIQGVWQNPGSENMISLGIPLLDKNTLGNIHRLSMVPCVVCGDFFPSFLFNSAVFVHSRSARAAVTITPARTTGRQ